MWHKFYVNKVNISHLFIEFLLFNLSMYLFAGIVGFINGMRLKFKPTMHLDQY